MTIKDLFLCISMYFVVTVLSSAFFFVPLERNIKEAIATQAEQAETIEVYTCENIYFLKGLVLTDELGRYGDKGVPFQSRNTALEFLAEITANDARLCSGDH